MRRFILAAAVLVSVLAISAREAWADVRYYLVPRIGDGHGVPLAELTELNGSWRPKYTDRGALGPGNDIVSWSAMPYGIENAFLLATDATTAQHNALAAQADVLAIPTALDSNVSGLAVTTIQTKLEAVNLPAEWVTTSLTYRDVLRRVGKMILFASRYAGIADANGYSQRWLDTVTLDTRWNQLTQIQQNRLRATADSLGLDYSGVINTMTLRQIIRLLGDQLPSFALYGNDF